MSLRLTAYQSSYIVLTVFSAIFDTVHSDFIEMYGNCSAVAKQTAKKQADVRICDIGRDIRRHLRAVQYRLCVGSGWNGPRPPASTPQPYYGYRRVAFHPDEIGVPVEWCFDVLGIFRCGYRVISSAAFRGTTAKKWLGYAVGCWCK